MPASLSASVYHHPNGITKKSGAKFVKKLFFWHCLATSGTDKQQHLDGKFDGEFSSENRLPFAKQLDKKLVHNRVGVTDDGPRPPGAPAPERLHRSPTLRWALWAMGVLALVLGAIGIVLPGLPTTPFVLLAGACFVRASPPRKMRSVPRCTLF